MLEAVGGWAISQASVNRMSQTHWGQLRSKKSNCIVFPTKLPTQITNHAKELFNNFEKDLITW